MTIRIALLVTVAAAACSRGEASPGGGHDLVSARRAADMVHAALSADRAVYTREVVQRLTAVQKVRVLDPERGEGPLEAREDWKSQHGALPLPAQVFRMGAESVLKQESGLSYLLLSPWPINRQNRSRTEVETRGLEAVTRSREPLYAAEELGGQSYFVAMYPDVAVSPACVACHNAHPDSPRHDFAEGDVMGAVVIRFPLD